MILIVIGAYFYMIFPGMGKKTGRSGNSEEHSGRIEGCMIKRSEFRENSMAAFREAIRANKGIELDVHLTKDKKIADSMMIL